MDVMCRAWSYCGSNSDVICFRHSMTVDRSCLCRFLVDSLAFIMTMMIRLILLMVVVLNYEGEGGTFGIYCGQVGVGLCTLVGGHGLGRGCWLVADRETDIIMEVMAEVEMVNA